MDKLQINNGFTLIELIVVISILSILSAIGMVTYTGYLKGVRDVNRISQLKSLSDTLNLFNTKYTLPLPENSIDVIANGVVIAYQGYLGKNIIDKIGYTSEGVDPKTGTYFSYYLTKDKKNFQLMGFLEEDNTLQASLINKSVVNANSDKYKFTFPAVYGQKLGILTTELNMPVQEDNTIKNQGFIDLGGTNSGTIYISRLSNKKSYSFTGYILENKLHTLSNPSKYSAPKYCPEGFIGVWGDAGFYQKGFCVAKYEMTYSDADIPDSVGTGLNTDVNSMHYVVGKEIVSMAGKYPIGDITIAQSVVACKTLGKGYHLITSNEWMSISRQIELESNNWSSGKVGDGIIYNGVSSSTSRGCDGTGGNTEPRIKGTKTGEGTDIVCNGKREKTLFNGEIIWDIAGNLREAIDGIISYGFTYSTVAGDVCGDDLWHSWYGNDGESECIFTAPYLKKSLGPLLNLNADNAIGRVQSQLSLGNQALARGGSAGDGSYVGIYSFAVVWDETSVNSALGFRCVK